MAAVCESISRDTQQLIRFLIIQFICERQLSYFRRTIERRMKYHFLLPLSLLTINGHIVLVQCFFPSSRTHIKTQQMQDDIFVSQRNRIQRGQQNIHTCLSMISFGGIGGKRDEDDTAGGSNLPRDVKEAVSKCRVATQQALQNRMSRMAIEFPVGTKFGVEKSKKTKATADGGPTKGVLDQSDRELARLFVEMFQPVGGENIVVAFTEQGLADMAKKQWKDDAGASSRVMAMNRRKGGGQKKKAKPKGFAAKLDAELADSEDTGPFELPGGTEVALFVAPGPKELVVIEKICEKVGMGTLVVLLNARMSKIDNFGTETAEKLFTEDFEQVFCLAAAPQEAAPDCLLYRSYPGNWVMARKPKVGQPKPMLTQDTKPTFDECQTAYDELEIGDLEKGVESALENVAGWFR